MMHFSVLLTMDPVQNICWQNSLSELKKKNIKHYLGLKKGKTRRVEITANNLFFLLLSLIHCWISTSCSQNCPSAWVKKWEQVLMLSSDSGQMGKRVTWGSSGAPGTAHWGALWGWKWQRAAESEPGHRATTPWGLTAPAPSHRENWGQRQGWNTPNKQKRICFSGKDWQKRCERSWSSISEVLEG